jgi:trehalose 6-phosphate phosphatase
VPADPLAALRERLDELLVAVDFDGTLAPIVLDPSTAAPVPGVVETMAELARSGVQLAVLTGREATTVVELGGLDAVPGIVVAGVYGAQWWRAGQVRSVPDSAAIGAVRSALLGVVREHATDPAIWIEDKRISLVVHTRAAADPDAELRRLRGPLAELAAAHGLEAHGGRDVVELRIPGLDKGGALQRVLTESGRRAVLLGGDDIGDLPAFELVGRLREQDRPAVAVAVVSGEVPELAAAATLTVPSPAAFAELLGTLLP